MAGRQKKIERREVDQYELLKRQYFRRYRNAPSATPSRRELIVDAAYAEAEALGLFAPERPEACLAALYYLLANFVQSLGVDVNLLNQRAADIYQVRLLPAAKLSAQEQELRDAAEARESFAKILAKARSAQSHAKRRCT